MEPMIIANEAELADACRESVLCSIPKGDNDAENMLRGILANPHPEFGQDWSKFWADSEDARWSYR